MRTLAGALEPRNDHRMDCCRGNDLECEKVTQILPECFVSVKLESSEDNTSVSQAEDDNQSEPNGTAENLELAVMENMQPHPVTTTQGVSSRSVYHHHGSSQWLSGCCLQAQEGERSLKGAIRHANINASTNSVSSVDTCESNSFLNCVLNQQLSGSIFFFDSTRAEISKSTNPNSHHNLEVHHSCSQENKQKNGQMCGILQSFTDMSHLEWNHTSNSSQKNHRSSYSVLRGENEPSTSTLSKCSQNAPYNLVSQNAENDAGDGVGVDVRSFSKEKASVLNHCSKCVSAGDMCVSCVSNHIVCEDVVKMLGNTSNKFNSIYHPGLPCTSPCSSRTCEIVSQRQEKKSTSDLDPGESSQDGSLCRNCSLFSNQSLNTNVKSEIITGSCDTAQGYVKMKQRLHYVDSDESFTCEICFKTYPNNTALVNHFRYHRGERPYQCETCNKAFATNSHLITHRRVHTGERPYQCHICHRSFADRSAFIKHERTHGPNGVIVKRFKCDECGSAFVDSCGLKKHIRIHTGERPYQCSVCEKSFSASSTFVAHKRIHSGERPYKCEQCSKMFITKSHLLTHRRTHTGEKPFTCHVCNRAFADGSSFRRHERLHTGENRHVCDVCGKGFPFDTSLAKHKMSHIPGSATYVYVS